MSAIKHGEKNIDPSQPRQVHPERAGQLGANCEQENQGAAPKGPGPRDQVPNVDNEPVKTPENKKRYLQRE